jgi:DNA-binding beta-propeller fold protein YncE
MSFPPGTGNVYVTDTGNDRVQYFTSAGAYLGQWGTSGTAAGQFISPGNLAVHPTTGNIYVTDYGNPYVQEFTASGAFVRRFGGSGSGNGQFTTPRGIAFEADGAPLYVSDADADRVQAFVETTSSTPGVSSFTSLHGWTGTGWHGLWTNDASDTPTWAAVAAPSGHYRLWWGSADGYAYWMPLRRGFHNPLQGFQAGIDTFAESGFLITSKFDAGMAGFTKIASHVVAQAISATSDETIAIEFAIDEGGWESLGTITAPGETRFSFGATGRAFNSLQFRLTLSRGSTTTLTPLLRSLTMLFVKVPQEAKSFVFTIVPSGADQGNFGRSGQAMFAELDDLVASNAFFTTTYNGQSFDHCRIASVTGHDNTSDAGGQRVVTVVELPTNV